MEKKSGVKVEKEMWDVGKPEHSRTVILVTSFPLLLVFLFTFYSVITSSQNYTAVGIFVIFSALICILGVTFILKMSINVTKLLVSFIYFAGSFYILFSWGINNPYFVLLFIIALEVSFTLFPPKSLIGSMLIISIFFCSVSALQILGYVQYDSNWSSDISVLDLIGHTLLLFLLLLTLYLNSLSSYSQVTRIYALLTQSYRDRTYLLNSLILKTKSLMSSAGKAPKIDALASELVPSKSDAYVPGSTDTAVLSDLNSLVSQNIALSSSLHDISNQLTSLWGALSSIDSPKMEAIHKQMSEISELVISARSEDLSGRSGVIDVVSVLKYLISLLHLSKERGVKVKIEQVDDEKSTLRGNVQHFKQIMLNLLINAVEYSPAGGVVNVKVWRDKKRNVCFVEIVNVVGVAVVGSGDSGSASGLLGDGVRGGGADSSTDYKLAGLGLLIANSLARESFGGSVSTSKKHGVFRARVRLKEKEKEKE